MYCSSCGKQLSEDAKFCSACGNPVKAAMSADISVNPPIVSKKTNSTKKKLPIFVVLPLIAVVVCSIFRLVQYSGYKSFLNEYFEAIETGDMDEITQFYSWEYVEEKNTKNMSNSYTQFFVYDDLEYYIESCDKYYRWFVGEEIEKIQIARTEKNMLSSTTQIEVEVYVVFENRADDVVVFIDMERGSDGWYMTGTDAYYASDEAED